MYIKVNISYYMLFSNLHKSSCFFIGAYQYHQFLSMELHMCSLWHLCVWQIHVLVCGILLRLYFHAVVICTNLTIRWNMWKFPLCEYLVESRLYWCERIYNRWMCVLKSSREENIATIVIACTAQTIKKNRKDRKQYKPLIKNEHS